MTLCGECYDSVAILRGDYTVCGECHTIFHFACCGVPKKLWQTKPKQFKEKWQCKYCRDKPSSTSKDVMNPFTLTNTNSPSRNNLESTSSFHNIFKPYFEQHIKGMEKMETTLVSILHEVKILRDEIRVFPSTRLMDGKFSSSQISSPRPRSTSGTIYELSEHGVKTRVSKLEELGQDLQQFNPQINPSPITDLAKSLSNVDEKKVSFIASTPSKTDSKMYDQLKQINKEQKKNENSVTNLSRDNLVMHTITDLLSKELVKNEIDSNIIQPKSEENETT